MIYGVLNLDLCSVSILYSVTIIYVTLLGSYGETRPIIVSLVSLAFRMAKKYLRKMNNAPVLYYNMTEKLLPTWQQETVRITEYNLSR